MPRSKIELRHVRYIIAAAESGSFRCAAQDFGVEQSAIIRRIRDVVDEIGAQLSRFRSSYFPEREYFGSRSHPEAQDFPIGKFSLTFFMNP